MIISGLENFYANKETKTDQNVLYYCKVNIRIFIQNNQLWGGLLLFLLVMAVAAARLTVVLLPPSCHHLGCFLAGLVGLLLCGF